MLFRPIAWGRIFPTSNTTVLNIKPHISGCRISGPEDARMYKR